MNVSKFIKGIFLCSILYILLSNSAYANQYNSSDVIVRVGIGNNNYSTYQHKNMTLSATDTFKVIDRLKGVEIATLSANDNLNVKMIDGCLKLFVNNKCIYSCLNGPIGIQTDNEARIQVIGLIRKGKPALYRGEFEIIKDIGHSNSFILVNVLPLEQYLKGVVPNEMPVSFGTEAVKAQSVAARNYTLRPRTKKYHYFDVCDSVQSQVYFGSNTEDSISNKAIEETRGLFALHNGNVILALYSSTAGGHTENYENAFSDSSSGSFPAQPLPYLKGVSDYPYIKALNKNEKAQEFYSSKPKSFDVYSSYFRWQKHWSRTELENILTKTLKEQSKKGFIKPVFKKAHIGQIKNIKVTKRGVSGKAMYVQIDTTTGKYTVSKELVIRRVFKKKNRILPSANIFFKLKKDDYGNITNITAIGGGLGHGVGMSQYGAGYLAQNGCTFDKILQHYYTDIAIGTWPVFLSANVDKKIIEQSFVSPDGKGDLILQNVGEIDNFVINVNDHRIIISKEHIQCSDLRLDISDYINKGLNTIKYCPPTALEEKGDGATVKSWVEVVKSLNERRDK